MADEKVDAPLDPAGRAILLERLAHRAERLAKIARFNAPDMVLGMMTEHVMKTAMAICGAEIQATFLRWMTGELREGAGLCQYCGRPKNLTMPMCAVCWEEMEQEDSRKIVTACWLRADETLPPH